LLVPYHDRDAPIARAVIDFGEADLTTKHENPYAPVENVQARELRQFNRLRCRKSVRSLPAFHDPSPPPIVSAPRRSLAEPPN